MHEFRAVRIGDDADVGRARPDGGEEHQIPSPQLISGNRAAGRKLLRDRTRNVRCEWCDDVGDKAAAVEAG